MKSYNHREKLIIFLLCPFVIFVTFLGFSPVLIASDPLPKDFGLRLSISYHFADEGPILSVTQDAYLISNITPINSIPEEPEEFDPKEVKAYYDWRNDMFFREFDLEGMGRVDFMTARRTYKVSLNEFGNSVALTMANPLFYWVDVNKNGGFEPKDGEMWSDPEEDGLNGNEQPYGL